MNQQPIGIFDSGVGGLTVVKEVMKQLPNESIIYFGDTARLPYGSKSQETVTKFSAQIIRFLQKKNVKAIIIACNTASSNSLEPLREMFDIPIIGVVEPGVEMAIERTRNGNIGIIGTEATIRSKRYPKLLKERNANVSISGNACPLFVPLVEDDWIRHEVAGMVAKEYLTPLIEKQIDTLILGCTHYPMLADVIQKTVGNEVALVNPAEEAARKMQKLLIQREELAEEGTSPSQQFYLSDNQGNFHQLAARFLQQPIDEVIQIDIEQY